MYWAPVGMVLQVPGGCHVTKTSKEDGSRADNFFGSLDECSQAQCQAGSCTQNE